MYVYGIKLIYSYYSSSERSAIIVIYTNVVVMPLLTHTICKNMGDPHLSESLVIAWTIVSLFNVQIIGNSSDTRVIRFNVCE